MTSALILGLALLAQSKPDPDMFPLALHRSMEIDDLDREIQRLHDTVIMKQAQLAATQRLAQRGAVSRSDMEREVASLRYEEAREAETRAYREIKIYERDVNGHAVPADERKAYELILDWNKAQEAIGKVDVDYRTFLLKQTQALYQRKAVGRQELEDAQLNFDMALASVSLSQSRQAQVMMELAARRGEKRFDPDDYDRLKEAYLRARIRYFENTAEAARRRYEIAQERSRRGLIAASELPIFQKSLDDADAALSTERNTLEQPDPPPTPAPSPAPVPPPAPPTAP
jgi:outer membrane protein TolC